MNAAEGFAIVLGLVIGYWLVSAYFDGSGRKNPPQDPPEDQGSSRSDSDRDPS